MKLQNKWQNIAKPKDYFFIKNKQKYYTFLLFLILKVSCNRITIF